MIPYLSAPDLVLQYIIHLMFIISLKYYATTASSNNEEKLYVRSYSPLFYFIMFLGRGGGVVSVRRPLSAPQRAHLAVRA